MIFLQRSAGFFLVWLLSALLLSVLLPTTAYAAGAITSLQQFNQLREDDARLRVIVELKAPQVNAMKPKASSTSGSGGWQSLGDYITQVQNQAIDELGWRNVNDLVRYQSIPALAKAVDKNQMQALLNTASVKAIYQSISLFSSLKESAGQVDLPLARQLGNGGKGQVVAVLDTGVDSDHPFLKGRVTGEACFSVTASCPNGQTRMVGKGAARPCTEDCSHGTHVAGIVAGRNRGMSGIAPDAKLLAVQVFFPNEAGGGARSDMSVILQGLDWVSQQGQGGHVAAVNLSLGGGRATAFCDAQIPPLTMMIAVLKQQGIATIAASGNEGFIDSISSPACVSDVVSVGSLTKERAVSEFSNSYRGLTIMAPGGGGKDKNSHILSSIPGGQYDAYQGTSMAAPHVAGAWAVLRGTYPRASYEQIMQSLLRGGEPYKDPRNNFNFATLNVGHSLEILGDMLGNGGGGSQPGSRPCTERVAGVLIESADSNCVD